jgi:hypothetical protein
MPFRVTLGLDPESLRHSHRVQRRGLTIAREMEETTTIIGGTGDKKALEGRKQQIRQQIKKTTSDYGPRSSRSGWPSSRAGWPSSAWARRRGGDEKPQGSP